MDLHGIIDFQDNTNSGPVLQLVSQQQPLSWQTFHGSLGEPVFNLNHVPARQITPLKPGIVGRPGSWVQWASSLLKYWSLTAMNQKPSASLSPPEYDSGHPWPGTPKTQRANPQAVDHQFTCAVFYRWWSLFWQGNSRRPQQSWQAVVPQKISLRNLGTDLLQLGDRRRWLCPLQGNVPALEHRR